MSYVWKAWMGLVIGLSTQLPSFIDRLAVMEMMGTENLVMSCVSRYVHYDLVPMLSVVAVVCFVIVSLLTTNHHVTTDCKKAREPQEDTY